MVLGFGLIRSARENRHASRIEIAGQSSQEGDQFGFFLRRETERFHQVGAARSVDAALVIMFDHLFERGDLPIMHIGNSSGDFAQAGRLESMLHLENAGRDFSASNIVAGQADVLKAVVGEVPSLMAR